jgi:UDP-N-acetylmuramoylalanine--D-glutamate ligase
MSLDLASLRGKRATVMGLGLFGGGVETARFLAKRGLRVTVTDLRGERELAESIAQLSGVDVRYALGGHRTEDFDSTELVVANPAVAPSSPFLAAARAAGVPVTSEMELFLEASPARTVLITGTQGKSSTCHALAGLLRAAGIPVALGGNIGHSLLAEVDHLRAADLAVVEISSYQLEALPPPRADGTQPASQRVAAVACTNVLADHLERHGSVESYEAAKRRILELAGPDAWVVLSGEDPRTSRWRPSRRNVLRVWPTRASDEGLNLANGAFRSGRVALGAVDELRLPGRFQRENTLAALGLAHALGAEPGRLAAAVGTLCGLEHRLEDLGLRGGHRVWDNGVSTTPDSTVAALRSLDAPLSLIAGGQAKNLPLDELAQEARARVRRVVTFGAARERLAGAFRDAGVAARACATLEEAVAQTFASLERGDEVLFSPACASFDAYRNFKDRAAAFRAALPPRTDAEP